MGELTIEQREQEVADATAALQAQQAAHDQTAAQFNADQQALNDANAKLAADQQALTDAQAALDAQKQAIADAQAKVDEQAAAVSTQAAALVTAGLSPLADDAATTVEVAHSHLDDIEAIALKWGGDIGTDLRNLAGKLRALFDERPAAPEAAAQ